MTRAVLAAAFVGASAAAIVFAQPLELGAPLDPAAFTYQRAIPDGPPGPVALVADPLTLAHSRGPSERFADVRILDSANRQVPYVIERRDDSLVVPLTAERADPPASAAGFEKRSNRSNYRLRLPCASLPPSKIAIETSARVFQRASSWVLCARPTGIPAMRGSRSVRPPHGNTSRMTSRLMR